jgi:hypothetical protein
MATALNEDSAAILYWKLKTRSRHMADGCIEWTRATNTQGYGVIRIDSANLLVHRAAWAIANGPIPEGMCVLHACDNPLCHNVDHLFLGTRQENLADMRRKNRQRSYEDCVGAPPGEQNPRAKLTNEQVLEIRSALGTHEEIANRYGISRRHVGDLRSRKRWRHLNG